MCSTPSLVLPNGEGLSELSKILSQNISKTVLISVSSSIQLLELGLKNKSLQWRFFRNLLSLLNQ